MRPYFLIESLINKQGLDKGRKTLSFSCTKEACIIMAITLLHEATIDLLLETSFSKGAGKYYYLLH